MSISYDFQEYKRMLTAHPEATCFDIQDNVGNVYRYHRYDESHAFAAIIDRRGCFHSLVKDIRLH